jgi:FtsH-binding integral membrane protein
VVGRQIVSLSARVLGSDAMTSKDTPSGAEGLGIWGNLGIWLAFGSSFGVVIGSFFDNVGLGVAYGPVLGLILWLVFIAPRRNDHSES